MVSNFPVLTILYGAALIVVGAGFYFGTGMASVTALIPAFIGLPVSLLGMIALKAEGARKHLMHVALVLALLALLGTLGRAIPVILSEGFSRGAIWAQLIVGLFSIAYIAVGIKSFIDARKSRAAQAA
ncbi:MAG: hypothetical protein RLY93_10665 [Sumerlaeia bacterium]